LKNFQFEDVKLKDSKTLYTWRNELSVRKNSFSKKKINIKTHENWLKKQLSEKKNYFWFFMFKKKKVGLVRLTLKRKNLILNYMVKKNYRKKGYSKKMLYMMIDKIKKNLQDKKIKLIAEIKKTNIISKKTLLSVGYKVKIKKNDILTLEYPLT
jgi:predicted acetyltransferase